jgi:hypothetical protein
MVTAEVYTDKMQLPIYDSIKNLPWLGDDTQIRAQIADASCPELVRVVGAWAKLPASFKAAIRQLSALHKTRCCDESALPPRSLHPAPASCAASLDRLILLAALIGAVGTLWACGFKREIGTLSASAESIIRWGVEEQMAVSIA